MDKLNFCITASNLYIHYLPNLLNSIDKIFNEYNLNINLVKPNVEQVQFVNSIKINNCKFKYINKFDPKLKSIEDLKGFSTNLRAKSLYDTSKNNSGILIYLDVNIVLLKTFKNILINLKNYDSAIIIDKNHWTLKVSNFNYEKALHISKKNRYKNQIGPLGTILKGCCLAGIQIYKINSKTKKFLRDYYYLVSKKKFVWFADQEALSILYLKYKNQIRFNLLSEDQVGLENYFPANLFAIYRKKGREKLYDQLIFFENNNKGILNKKFFSRDYLFQKKGNIISRIFRKFIYKFKFIFESLNFFKILAEKIIFKILNINIFKNKISRGINFQGKNLYFLSNLYLTSYAVSKGIRTERVRIFCLLNLYIIIVPRKFKNQIAKLPSLKILPLPKTNIKT